MVTFMVFPGVTNAPTLTFLDQDGRWFQIALISTFNLFDTIGRYMGGQPKYFISNIAMQIWAWIRLIHIAAFVVFYMDRFEILSTTTGDVLKMTNLVLFSFSNGYLQTLCCCWAPMGVSDEKNQESVGYVISLTINLGIIIGSVF
jgi:hypothetical protein